MLSQPTSASADPVEFVDRVGRQLDVGSGDILAQVRHGGGAGDEQDSGGVITPGEISSSRLSSASVFSPVRIRWTVVRLNSVLKTRRPSAFRRCSPMGPPVASYVPTVSSRNGEHSRARSCSSQPVTDGVVSVEQSGPLPGSVTILKSLSKI